MLWNFLVPKHRDYPETMIFQRDSAPPLCHWSKRISGQKSFWTMDGKRSTDFMACALSRFDYLWLLSLGIHKGYFIPGSSTDYYWIEDKNSGSNPSHKRRYSQASFQRRENSSELLYTWKGGHFEYTTNKNITSVNILPWLAISFWIWCSLIKNVDTSKSIIFLNTL